MKCRVWFVVFPIFLGGRWGLGVGKGKEGKEGGCAAFFQEGFL